MMDRKPIRRSNLIHNFRIVHARRANFFCSTSKYSRAEHAQRAACSTLCSPNISEQARRAANRSASRPIDEINGQTAFTKTSRPANTMQSNMSNKLQQSNM
uniref:Uncharacterized protein n=1 Tax=Romanomermis culicivorax TaxID=13658 RepID=A0A915JCT1_ROMCU